ncbi:MAG TPA: dTDP-4-dehydrorhamnose 3,5-epimerase [Haliangiales bacterium]|nr:dTDP-4-dehydrorhamnose 3,5-epimerase [Haliangiales bacterium]
MNVLETGFREIILLQLEPFADARGVFVESYRRSAYARVGIDRTFVQDNFSQSRQGTIRGLHYQLRRPQGKLVHVTRGEVWDVAADIRQGSPTFGKWFGTTLSAENRRQLWIPEGFAHGFVVRSDIADVAYKITAEYDPDDDRAIAWNDPTLAIPWAVEAPLLSKKDAAAPPLAGNAHLPSYVP